MFKLENKVAVITGGAGVLAGAMANGLIHAGAKVAILDLYIENAEKRAGELEEMGGEAIGLKANVLDIESLNEAYNRIIKKWGKVDILINAAGGNMKGATIMPDQNFFDLDMDDFQKVTALNLNGSVLPVKVFGKSMAERKKGCIINISSMTAQQAVTRVLGYSSSKAAIDIFTKWLAVEMAHKYGEGIRVNAIAPGFFIGEQNRRLLTEEDGSLTKRGQIVISKTPANRFGEPEDLISTLLWLCSDASKFVTGVVVPVDGGFSAFSGV